MSFDVFVQRMVDGELATTDSDALRELIAPHVTSNDPEFDFAKLQFEDGTADLYGYGELGSGFMINHVTSRLAWDLVATLAARGGMTLTAPGAPPMISSESARTHLPDGLGDEAVVIGTGADILRTLADT